MKFYQLTPMKIDKFQTIYEIIDVFVIFLLFRKYSLYIANKRYRGNICEIKGKNAQKNKGKEENMFAK